MIWQDLVFLAGNIVSIVTLTPTLRDTTTRIPLATTVPSATIGLLYGVTFFTLGMTFSALGALVTAVLWTLICALRSPHRYSLGDAQTNTASFAVADD